MMDEWLSMTKEFFLSIQKTLFERIMIMLKKREHDFAKFISNHRAVKKEATNNNISFKFLENKAE